MKPLYALAAALVFASAAHAETFRLDAAPDTVAWGNYDAKRAPVLHIKSGDTVVFRTLLTNSPSGLSKAGVKDADIEQALKDVFDKVPLSDRGPGGHILNGPVYIDGAEPGDTLEIRIDKIELAIPYAYNAFRYGAGLLTDDFPYSRIKIIPLDKEKMLAHFAPGIDIPLHPFFGSMGVAPPAAFGRYDSAPPTIIGGNMDNKELVAGSTLYLPVWNKGALFQIGDGHAGQGNGEVDITAMGFDDDLSIAAHKAVREMIDFLVSEKGLSRDDAYMLTSVAGDADITEIVDRNKGAHVMMPKAVFSGK